jgi:hypothetical protein
VQAQLSLTVFFGVCAGEVVADTALAADGTTTAQLSPTRFEAAVAAEGSSLDVPSGGAAPSGGTVKLWQRKGVLGPVFNVFDACIPVPDGSSSTVVGADGKPLPVKFVEGADGKRYLPALVGFINGMLASATR